MKVFVVEGCFLVGNSVIDTGFQLFFTHTIFNHSATLNQCNVFCSEVAGLKRKS